MNKTLAILPGLVITLTIAILAHFLAPFIPLGSVTLAIIMGIIIGNSVRIPNQLDKGITFSEKHLLSIAIALMGFKLNFTILENLGFKAIVVIVVAMAVTIGSGLVIGKLFKLDMKFALLLGIGNGVCGSSAIAATNSVIKADEEEVGLSIAIVNFLGTIGIFLLPFIALHLKFSDLQSGVLIGNTLQAVGQVVAAGFSLGEHVGQTATIVKMTRILMLFPLIFILIAVFASKGKSTTTDKKFSLPAIPPFVIGFVLFSLVPTFNLLPPSIIATIGEISEYLLIIAMAGIGLKITFKSILQDGKSALIVGALVFLLQIIFTTVIMITLFS